MINKDAIEYIAELGQQAQHIVSAEIDGETYIKGHDVKRVLPDYMSEVDLKTLESTVDYIRDCIKQDSIKKPFIVKADYQSVKVYSGIDEYKKRELLVSTSAQLPRINLNEYMYMEEFIIQLNTCFIDSDNVKKLTSIVSTITDQSSVDIHDDGIGITVKQTQGTAVKKTGEMSINPICLVTPYRTFGEVEQPSSKFLLRVKDGGRMALFEADGGMWKLEAQDNVSKRLRGMLDAEIKDGTVVVVG